MSLGFQEDQYKMGHNNCFISIILYCWKPKWLKISFNESPSPLLIVFFHSIINNWTVEGQWSREVVARPLHIRSLQIVSSPPHTQLFVPVFFLNGNLWLRPLCTCRNSTMTAIDIFLYSYVTQGQLNPWAAHRCDPITELRTRVVALSSLTGRHVHFPTERVIQDDAEWSVIAADRQCPSPCLPVEAKPWIAWS